MERHVIQASPRPREPRRKRIFIVPLSLVNMQVGRQLAVLLKVVEARVHETAGTQISWSAASDQAPAAEVHEPGAASGQAPAAKVHKPGGIRTSVSAASDQAPAAEVHESGGTQKFGSVASDQAPAAEVHEPGGTKTSVSAAFDQALSAQAADELARVAAALGAAAALAQQNGRCIDWLQSELMKRDSQIWLQQQEMKQLSWWLQCQQQLRQGEQASQQMLLQQQMTVAHQEAIMQQRSDHALVRLQLADQQRLQRQQVQQQLPQQTLLRSILRDLQQKLQRTERDLMVHQHCLALCMLHTELLQGTER